LRKVLIEKYLVGDWEKEKDLRTKLMVLYRRRPRELHGIAVAVDTKSYCESS